MKSKANQTECVLLSLARLAGFWSFLTVCMLPRRSSCTQKSLTSIKMCVGFPVILCSKGLKYLTQYSNFGSTL